jgi:hypothetical protein
VTRRETIVLRAMFAFVLGLLLADFALVLAIAFAEDSILGGALAIACLWLNLRTLYRVAGWQP